MPLRNRVHKIVSLSYICTHRLFGFGFALFVVFAWTVVSFGGIWSISRSSLHSSSEWQRQRRSGLEEGGTRLPARDRTCHEWISHGSGYCECLHGQTTKRLKCGRHPRFQCQAECRALRLSPFGLLKLPGNVTCKDSQRRPPGAQQDQDVGDAIVTGKHSDISFSLWRDMELALHASGGGPPQLPELRSAHQDWVRDGLKLPGEVVLAARTQWQQFMKEAPGYPRTLFKGRGIAILGGGPQYMVPAWVNVHMLRAAGCLLPVEMFFPESEYPSPQVVAALAAMGVVSRALPQSLGGQLASMESGRHQKTLEETLSGFTLKVAAVLLCSFREVLFLDSDNVPARSPEFLFATPEYKEHGALLWPDYWTSSVAPDLRAILGVHCLPDGTTESGQMLFDKARVWKALVLAAYFNMQSSFYYELFSNFMGKGDKESFAFAFAATQLSFHKIPHPVGSMGLMRQYCSSDHVYCWEEFVGNTMTQYTPDGQLLFLHTNLSPKWNLQIPGDFKAYTRRWQVLAQGKQRVPQLASVLGRDIEHDVWQALVDFRCQDFYSDYILEGGSPDAAVLGIQGFHPENEGVNFREAYRWGLSGDFERFTQADFGDGLQHCKNTRIKPIFNWLRRALLIVTGHNSFFLLL